MQELIATVPGVAFASPDEARSSVERPKSEVAQGVLCSKDVTGTGLELRVTVKDSKGQPGERKRFLIQLGKVEFTHTNTNIPPGGIMNTKAVQVTMNVQKQLVKGDLWNKWMKDPLGYTREWLSEQGIKASDVLPPTLRDGNLRIVLWLSAGLEEALQKLIGCDAALTGKYIDTDEDKHFFSVVPLLNATREEALKRADYHGSDTWGVVPPRNGS